MKWYKKYVMDVIDLANIGIVVAIGVVYLFIYQLISVGR